MKTVPAPARFLVAGRVMAGLVILPACHKPTPAEPAPKAYPSAPVESPAGLVADLVARGPDGLWGKLQQGVAGPLAHLPGTVGGLLAATAKVDLTLAGEIDGAAPSFGAVTRAGTSFGWLGALKLRDPAHARAALLEGQRPRFVGRELDGGIVVLNATGSIPGGSAAPADASLALSPLGYLLVASSEADLLALAPYATRTLPTRPPSSHGVVVATTHAALAGAVDQAARTSLAKLRDAALALDQAGRKEHGGKAPDFGDPAALVHRAYDFVTAKLALVADLDHAELTVDAGDDDLSAELSLVPGTGASAKAFASYATGDASPLLSISSETEAAILLRDDPQTRAEETKSVEEATLAVFERTLRPADVAAIHGAFAGWTAARGPWLSLAVELSGAPALTLRTPTPDADRAMRAVGDFVDLTEKPVFHQMLAARLAVVGVSTATAAVAGSGSTSIATFRRKATPGKGAEAPEPAVAWTAAGDILRVGAASSSARALRATKDPERLLGVDIRLAGKLGTLRDRAAVVLVARPNLGTEVNGPRASFVLAAGHDKARDATRDKPGQATNGWATVDVDDALVRTMLGHWLEP